MEPVRVAVVSDDPLARSGLSAMLARRQDVTVTAVLPTGPGGPDPAMADVALVDAAGSDPERVRELARGFPTVVLAADEAQAAAVVAAGARGVVLRDVAAGRLAAALVAVHLGLTALDGGLAGWIRPPHPAASADAEALTPREVEVLSLLAEALPNKAIAQRLGVTERTAKFHVESILAKLGAETRSEAIVLAARRGLIAL